jgi:hypothetical protein
MQQKILGWRLAAERTRRRRAARELPLAPPARMMADTATTACRAVGRMAVRVRSGSRAGIAAMPAMDGTNAKRAAGALGLLMAGIGVVRWMTSRPGTSRDRVPKNRWIMVTVNCSPERLASRSDLPDPIIRLGDSVDIKVSPAPGDRGTELGARLHELPRTKIRGMVMRRPEEDPRRVVERALREAKSLIEAGEVVRPDWPPSVQPAQVGKLLEFAGRRGGRL